MPVPPELADAVSACRRSHERLWQTVAGLDDDAVRRPSLLPDWTVGHVLAHLAGNADALARLLAAAADGRETDMYPGGPEARARAIDDGAARPAAAILDELSRAASGLEAAMAAAPAAAWAGRGRGTHGGTVPCRFVPGLRRREVEVHHADLGLGYGPADWPADFVDEELPQATAGLADRLVVPSERAATLAWLMGRAPQPAAPQLSPWTGTAPPRRPPPGR